MAAQWQRSCPSRRVLYVRLLMGLKLGLLMLVISLDWMKEKGLAAWHHGEASFRILWPPLEQILSFWTAPCYS